MFSQKFERFRAGSVSSDLAPGTGELLWPGRGGERRLPGAASPGKTSPGKTKSRSCSSRRVPSVEKILQEVYGDIEEYSRATAGKGRRADMDRNRRSSRSRRTDSRYRSAARR